MQPLGESIAMFSIAGLWPPITCTKNELANFAYRLYTLISLFLVYTLTLSELIGAILLTRSLEDFTDISFLLLSTMSVCCKAGSMLVRRDKIAGLIEMLQLREYKARNSREFRTLDKFNRIIRFLSLGCISLAEITVGVMSIGPLLQDHENRVLPFKSWLPYELTSDLKFWLAYAHQTIAIFICATINVANDTLICGFMLQTCSQLELLSDRLLELPDIVAKAKAKKDEMLIMRSIEASIMSRCINHHNHIFRFAKNMNDIFTPVIVVQFCMSSIVLSLSVYQLAVRSVNGIQFFTMILYLSCMLVEFFMYCWFGNELTLKSLEFSQAIYDTDWINLQMQTMKSLIVMMLRSRRPIVVSCGSIITLSIKSFTAILKTSYSAFNLLLRSSS